MIIQIVVAFLAGVLTIAAPCVFPVLPILFGASVGHRSKTRPLFIAFGFVAAFSIAALALSALVNALKIPADLIRNIAVGFLTIFGLLMIFPKPFELLTARLSGAMSFASGKAGQAGSGNLGGFALGLILGFVWTPCAGPVLGSILTLIAAQRQLQTAGLLLIMYALGAGLPMLIIAYGSQALTVKIKSLARYTVPIQQIFGGIILLVAVAMFFQFDTLLTNSVLSHYNYGNLEANLLMPKQQKQNMAMSAKNDFNEMMIQSEIKNYGPAPDFTGATNWLNSNPLSLNQLKGKVVLVDFWTYSCINCVRTLPYTTSWYNTYQQDGLVIVGVHTPEFEFEKVPANVQNAIGQHGIKYPVAQDNNYTIWNAYNNEYWPAEYLIDKNGNIVYEHFGEGNYDLTENVIRYELGMPYNPNAATSSLGNIQSPEMYFEPSRLQYLYGAQQPNSSSQNYSLPNAKNLPLNNFALGGQWQFDSDHAQTTSGNNKILLHFQSGQAFMVAAADHPITLQIIVDGKKQAPVTVSASQLYTLFKSSDYSEHTMEIEIPDSGFQAFTFTFG